MKGNLSKKKGLLSTLTNENLDYIAEKIAKDTVVTREDIVALNAALEDINNYINTLESKDNKRTLDDVDSDLYGEVMTDDHYLSARASMVLHSRLRSDLQERVSAIEDSLRNTDVEVQKTVNNKVTTDAVKGDFNHESLSSDEKYLSALLTKALIEKYISDLTPAITQKQSFLDKVVAEGESKNTAPYYSAMATDEKLFTKEDKTNFIDPEDGNAHLIYFHQMYKSEIRIPNALTITLEIYDGEYEPDYISGLSFDSGEKATSFDYTGSGIINWVGTDCTTSEGYSIFQPSPNTHYDIIFYFNGVQFIGLVNGFVPATRNVVSE